MFGLGTKEIIILAVVLVLLFGSKKIPELANGIVEAIRNLRRAFTDDDTSSGKGSNKK
jgi:sec-independent protein translocase protein TatA